MTIVAPAILDGGHDVSDFRCQHAELAEWLRDRARRNQSNSASRTYVMCEGARVVGFYSLAAGSVERQRTPTAAMRRNMPEPIPAIVLGRLAIDERWQGRGLGADLLSDAVQRSLIAAQTIAARVLICHAVDAQARGFYVHHGFQQSPMDDLVVMLDLAKARDVAL